MMPPAATRDVVRQRPAPRQYGGGALDVKRRMMAYAGAHMEAYAGRFDGALRGDRRTTYLNDRFCGEHADFGCLVRSTDLRRKKTDRV